jgi:hypothetical protein
VALVAVAVKDGSGVRVDWTEAEPLPVETDADGVRIEIELLRKTLGPATLANPDKSGELTGIAWALLGTSAAIAEATASRARLNPLPDVRMTTPLLLTIEKLPAENKAQKSVSAADISNQTLSIWLRLLRVARPVLFTPIPP